eukprot:TRINITY_DN11500_c0_g1_i1.p1 TRINITY_DN11500_c0_g1~~TRINITY_DN11500_c0_g1_i1.p1  ORF type:complete len:406 (+),score=87.22 TRINITY_DN11500_c0_g1_i1:53-1219(+)
MPKRKSTTALRDRTNEGLLTPPSKRVLNGRRQMHWTEYRPVKLVDFKFKDEKGNQRVAAVPGGYENVEFLAAGAFGAVLGAEVDGARVVVKMIECDSAVQMESAIRELHNLSFFTFSAPHPNIITLSDVWYANNAVFLTLPMYDTSLDKILDESPQKKGKKHCIPTAPRARLSAQLLSAVIHLHSLGIVHRDLKPGNVVVTKDLEKLCVIDLGSLRKPEIARERGPPLTPAKNVMTEGYFPPEVLTGNAKAQYGHEADNFAVGLIIASMIKGTEIFEDNKEAQSRLDSLKLEKKRKLFVTQLFSRLEGVPPLEIECITSLLAAHPAARATSHQIFKKLTKRDPSMTPLASYDEPVYDMDDEDAMLNVLKNNVAAVRARFREVREKAKA